MCLISFRFSRWKFIHTTLANDISEIWCINCSFISGDERANLLIDIIGLFMALRSLGSVLHRARSPILSRALSSARHPLRLSSVSDNHADIYEESLRHPEHFWGDLARKRLRWMKKFDQVMQCDMNNGKFSWFGGGTLNVAGKPLNRATYKHSIKT